ncbi:progranulin-like [Stigmatopora argus]
MQSFAVFCWVALILVHGPLGGTCQDDDGPTSSLECGPSGQGMVCLNDNRCCPEGHRCSADSLWCIKTANSILCDDKVHCKMGETCCPNSQGGWSCCPFPQAVCCPDKMHCCPKDYTCNERRGKCVKGEVAVPFYRKLPARMDGVAVQPNSVRCDDTTTCSYGQTCCKISSTRWGCCPFSKGVCCADMVHCCPMGFTCTPKGGCIISSLPWLNSQQQQLKIL